MMSGKPPDLILHHLAHSLASDVIGFAAQKLSEIVDSPDGKIMENWGVKESESFMKIYLGHLNDAYNMQIKSLKKFEEKENG